MKKGIFITFLALTSLIVLFLFEFIKYNSNSLRIVICDVGQGDAILITTPNKTQILIDGGPDKSVLACLSSNMPFWDRSIDAVILTHPHADHLYGLIDVVDRYNVSYFYTSNEDYNSQIYDLLKAKIADKKLSAKVLSKNDVIKENSGVSFKVISTASNQIIKSDQNNSNYDLNQSSVVLLLDFNDFEALFTGDAESGVLESNISDIPDIEFLKVPHHGSRIGMSDLLLNKSKPEVAAISVGDENKYGHPTKEAINFLVSHKIKYLRTDMDGDIEIESNGKLYYVTSK